MSRIYNIKYVERPSDGSLGSPHAPHPIIVGPRNESSWSYSAAVATVNALLMTDKIQLPSIGVATIGADDLMSMLGSYAFEYGSAQGEDGEMMAMQVFEELNGFVLDDVEVKCPSRKGLTEITSASNVFRCVGLEVLNGTLIDPNIADGFAQLGLTAEQGETYRPLTPYGYRRVLEHVQEGKAYILAFGGRFFALLKHDGQLLVLATDTALIHDTRIVWQRLDRIYGNEIFLDANFHSVIATAEIDDFTMDLFDVQRVNCIERLEDYRALGYSPDASDMEGLDELIEQQRAELGSANNPAGEDTAESGRNNADENVESDHEMAMRLQREMDMEELMMGGAPQQVQASDLEAALAASMRDSTVGGEPTARAAAQSGETRRWNLELVVALEVRNKYYFDLCMRTDTEKDWEVWQTGVNAVRYCESDLTHPQDLPYGLDSAVVDSCSKIMRRAEKLIPDEMRECAEFIVMEERLDRPEEHACLARLLEGDGYLNYENETKKGPKKQVARKQEKHDEHVARYAQAIMKTLEKKMIRDPNGVTISAIKQGCKKGDFRGKPWDNRLFHGAMKAWVDAGAIIKTKKTEGNRETLYKLAKAPGADDYDSDDGIPDLTADDWDHPAFGTKAKPVVSPEEKAATALQASWRGYTAQQDYKRQRPLMVASSKTIQASWRGYAARRNTQYIAAATIVQAPSRGFLEKRRYEKKKNSATRLAAVSRGFLARQYFLRILSAIRINAVIRTFLAKRRYGDAIKAGFEEWKRVNEQWKPVQCCVAKARAPDYGLFSWRYQKETTFDISQAEADTEGKETAARIDAARDAAASDDENDDGNVGETTESSLTNVAVGTKAAVQRAPSSQVCDELPLEAYDNIMLTEAVLKWFKRADPKYQGFFLRRMRQFANGEYERSTKLRKNLTGCKHIIYEAYLEQKVAQRILFTECRTKGENDGKVTTSILVWYVSKHDHVPRYIKQIDEAEGRMNRQFTAAASHLIDDGDEEGGAMVLDNDTILLDPLANTPLKIHHLPSTEIGKLELDSWTPPFRLTNDERKIVQTPGTVLVLGRSGTGKTVCIVNRMVFDANFHRGDTPLKQLFISRSHRIKNLVRDLVEEVVKDTPHVESEFISYERVVGDCNAALSNQGLPTTVPAMEESKLERKFFGFKTEFFPDVKKELKVKLSALVVWTQIRSFIKGSIEAVMHGRPLTLNEYLGLGAKYCRLNQDQRKESYAVYEKYSSWLESNNYHDSCDRTVDLLNRIRKVPIDERAQNKLRFDRIYIDECQDFTSADFAFFWTLCQGGGNLFLAGDTAQSVEQGISFRFEEVKRVFYELGKGDRSGIPSSPLSVHINFRSHAGVLEVAAEVLKMLHDAFPGAANKLRGDEGLFKGPRPCILSRKEEKFLGLEALQDILNKNPSLVLLTPDENKDALEKQLGAAPDDLVILGICEAKGLDFDECIIVDFFSTASKQLGKAWKELFRKTMSSNKNVDMNLQDKFPELEMRLKLLYTAITRCRHRLFFVETQQSSVGEAFSRWVLGTDLTEKQDVADLSLQLKSADEWRSLGVDYAINAESMDTVEDADMWFRRASSCFKRASDDSLSSKAESQAMIHAKANLAYDKGWDEMKTEVPGLLIECLEDGGFIDEALDICENLRDRCPMNEKKLKVVVDDVIREMNSAKHLM